MCEIVKKKKTGIEFLQLRNFHLIMKNLLHRIFCLFLLLCVIKRSLYKKESYGVKKLVFNILDAIVCKKWVQFVSMQEDSATLIYQLSTIKGAVGVSLNYHSHSKQYCSKPPKNVLKSQKR